MKHSLFLSFLILSFASRAQTDTLKYYKHIFSITKVAELNDYGSFDTIATVRKKHGKDFYIYKKFALHRVEKDCNNTFTDKGKYYLSGDSLIFETTHLQLTGLDPIIRASKEIQILDSLNAKFSVIYDSVLPADSDIWQNKERKTELVVPGKRE
jgi:hypothetical protein